MRVAVLADIHGNLPALDAVLADVQAVGVDRIVLNGDLLTGPMPMQTLERLRGLGDQAVWIRGNADRELVAAYDGEPNDLPEVAVAPTEYCAAHLSRKHRDFLDGLPQSATLEVTGLGKVLFCHATGRSDTEIVLVDSPLERFREAFAGSDEPTVVLGHTHMPFDRLADRRRFVNPGSVGMPYAATPAAYWGLLGPDVVLRRTAYDPKAAADTILAAAPDYPDVHAFIADNVLNIPSDAEALAAFS
ncbi:metallophosphoesterase family protein [Fodinicola acaciae]|uniref:metallophosphoesterase family protein n=1 Tax=Fodinicola acaciae TaxID=2681555 RepID=UPI0013D48462|nr:metallophosphoesterase family protein [Fodinicola acaciae]